MRTRKNGNIWEVACGAAVAVGKAGLVGVTIQTLTGGGLHNFLAVLNVVVNITSIVAVLTVKRNSGQDVRTRVDRVNSGVVVVRPNTSIHNNIQRSTSTVRALGLRSCRSVISRAHFISTISPSIGDDKRTVCNTGGTPAAICNVDPSCLRVQHCGIRSNSVFARRSVRATTGMYIINGAIISGLFPSNDGPMNGIVHFRGLPFHVMNILRDGKCGDVKVSRSSLVLTPCAAVRGGILTVARLRNVAYSTLGRRCASRTVSRVSRVLHHGRGLGRDSSSSFAVHDRRRLDAVLADAASVVAILLTTITNVSLLMNNVKVVGVVCIDIARHAHRVNLHVDVKTGNVSVLTRFLVRSVLVDIANNLVNMIFKINTTLIIGKITRFPVCVRP